LGNNLGLARLPKRASVSHAVGTAQDVVRAAVEHEEIAAQAVRRARAHAAVLRDRPLTQEDVDRFNDRLRQAERQHAEARSAVEQAERDLERAKRAAEEQADDHPRQWSWKFDADLKAAGQELDKAQDEAAEPGNEDQLAQAVTHARQALEREVALEAAGGGTAARVERARADLSATEHALAVEKGQRLLREQKVKELRLRREQARQAAAHKAARKYGTEGLAVLVQLADVIVQLRTLNARYADIWAAAEASFGWSSPEALEFGHAARLPRGGVLPPAVLGLLDAWTAETAELRGTVPQEHLARAAADREAQEERARRQQAAHEWRLAHAGIGGGPLWKAAETAELEGA
jgi:hypothetical protein